MKYGALDSIPREANINGQFHQLSYIRPDEAELLKSMGGAGTAGPGGVPQYGWKDWANDNLGTSFDTSSSSSTSTSTSSNNNSNDNTPTTFTAIKDTFTEIFTLGTAETDTYNRTEPSNTFVTDVGQAASDTLKEIITLGTAETQTYNEDKYNLNYDATGGNTTTGTTTTTTIPDVFYDINGVSHATQAAADAANIAINASGGSVYQEYADSMKEAGVLSLGGKQIPDEPDVLGNTPIFQYMTGNEGSYEVVGGLDPDEPATMSYNDDGTLFVPYDGQDPATINTDDFQTDLPVNGAAILNEIGKNNLLETGDDSKMITVSDGGGYEYVDGTQITNEVFETDVNQAIADGIIDPYVGGAGDEIVIGGGMDDFGGDVGGGDGPITRQVRGTKDLYGDFYGGQSGGLWNRFQGSYLTRFNQPTQGIDEMVRVVEQEDGSKLYYGADGALLNPDAIGQIRISGDPTSLKIGEQNVLLGTQTLNPDGTVKDTSYTDLYDPEIDAGLFNYQ